MKTGKLKANKAAAEGSVEFAYIEYARLSLDGVHCSVTALGRHLSKERVAENRTEIVVSVEARRSNAEILSTILHLCRALTGVTIGANEILGFTTASGQLDAMVTEFENNGWGRTIYGDNASGRGEKLTLAISTGTASRPPRRRRRAAPAT